MARATFTVAEREIKNNLITKIKNRLGAVHEGRDSAIMAFSETIGDELAIIRRETSLKLNELQLSNATGNMLDELALSTYGLLRKPASTASVEYEESNLHFYVEEGVFGSINNGEDIILPAGTEVMVKDNSFGDNIIYELTETYTLDSNQNIAYCSARSKQTGFGENVDRDTLTYHNFKNYTRSDDRSLKVSNRFAILNGSDKESDRLFKSRLNNFLQAKTNLNEDWLLLRAIMVPGIANIKLIENYYGIGTLGLIVYGAGKESNESLINLVKRRVREVSPPGLSIEVTGGITVYLDFDIKIYVVSNLSNERKQNLKSLIKEEIYNIIESAEDQQVIDFIQISNFIKSNVHHENMIGFGKANNGSIFEKAYFRKTDRFGALPEYRNELISNEYLIGDDERVSFGIVNINLEDGDL